MVATARRNPRDAWAAEAILPGRLDSVTQLPNRVQLIEDLRRAPAGVLVLVNLTDPRIYNEVLRALGHERAEAFIRAGAERLAEALPRGQRLYHVSGLSLVSFFPGADTASVGGPIDRITEAFREPLVFEHIPIDIQIAIGLKASEGAGTAAEDLRGVAAAAQDCRASGAASAWYDAASDALQRRAFRLLTDLKTALSSETQLGLVFQPKVWLADDRCHGAEALLRWTHPELGPVSPGEFVPLAEATALVEPLTRWVISAAIVQLGRWKRDGLDINLAVNVSPKNLVEPDFVEYLLFCCAAEGIDRDRLELEITEGVSAEQGTLILGRLATLRNLGFRIAIDDFGSGYSNMSYLTRLSAQTLKIDRSLVRGVEHGTLEGRLVSGIIQMGHDLGFNIVAEGIETAAERALVASWGCEIGQGWLFGRPMVPGGFVDWLSAKK